MEPRAPELDLVGDPTETVSPQSNQRTARRAKEILVGAGKGYRDVTANERATLAQAFAALGYVIYGRAFDLVRATGDGLRFDDLEAAKTAISGKRLFLVEVKATSRKASASGSGSRSSTRSARPSTRSGSATS
jgi:hypothetical protein